MPELKKKEYFRVSKQFFFPSPPEELYNKAIEHMKRNEKSPRRHEYIVEEEKTAQFIQFRIIDKINGDYGRSSSISIKPIDEGSEVVIITPKAKFDDLFWNPVYIYDDILEIYKFLGGEVSSNIIREIYPIDKVNGIIIEGFAVLFFITIIFIVLIFDPFGLYHITLVSILIGFVFWGILAYFICLPILRQVIKYLNIKKMMRV